MIKADIGAIRSVSREWRDFRGGDPEPIFRQAV
jgi:hypothetical protein